MTRVLSFALIGALVGCTGGNSDVEEDGTGAGDPLLGNGANSLDAVNLEVVLDADMEKPRDLAFNPLAPNELWIVSQKTESVNVILDVTDVDGSLDFDDDAAGPHFLAQPAALAFGENGAMATAHDTDEKTQGANGTPEDFMGPTLWTTDLEDFDGGHIGHIDMLHNSPLGIGIEWERGNRYWMFDGYHSSITMYDFNQDHGLGGSDHSDGECARYIEGEVKRADNGTHAGMWFDHDTDELLVSDPGNNRIIALDTKSGEQGGATAPNYDGGEQYEVLDAEYAVLIDGEEVGLDTPSGMAVHNGVIYVADAGNPSIWAFSRDGELIDYLDITSNINGIAIHEDGSLYFVDPDEDVVYRLSAK